MSIKSIVATGLLFFLISYPIVAQENLCKVIGKVVDNKKRPLVYSNVTFSDSIGIKYFFSTDSVGIFNAHIPCEKNYNICITYLGYTTYCKHINTSTLNEQIIIYELETASEVLDVVEITERLPPISQKEETITINADSFFRKSNDKLVDLLSNIPGIRISDNNEIIYMGEKVKELLVEGKSFFNGEPSLGLKNIPSQSVSAVEIIKDYNDIEFLKGLSAGNRLAMNLKLKEGYKNFGFGDVEGGIGFTKRYTFNPTYFRFSPQIAVSGIGNINNSYEPSLSISEYLRLSGSELLTRRYKIFNSILSEDNILKPPAWLIHSDFASIENQLTAVNINASATEKITLASTLIYNSPSYEAKRWIHKKGVIDNLSIDQSHTFSSNTGIQNVFFDLWARYKINNNSILDLRLGIKNEEYGENSNRKIEGINQSNSINENRKNITNANNVNIQWVQNYTRKTNSIVQINIKNSELNKSDRWNIDNVETLSFLQLGSTSNVNINQNISPIDLSLELFFRLNYLINRENQIVGISEHNRNTQNDYTYATYENNSDELLPIDNNQYINNWQYKSNITRAGLYHYYQPQKAKLKYGLSLYNTIWTPDEISSTDSTIIKVLPSIDYTLNHKSLGTINISYMSRFSLPEAEMLRQGTVLEDFNSTVRGYRGLNMSQVNSWSLSFKKSNSLLGRQLSLILSRTRTISPIITNYEFIGINPQLKYVNIRDSYLNHKINFTFSKNVVNKINNRKFIYISNQISYFEQPMLIDLLLEKVNTAQWRLSSFFYNETGENIGIKIGYDLSANRIKNKDLNRSFTNHELYMKFSFNWNKAVFGLIHRTNMQFSGNLSGFYHLTTFSCRYNFDSKWVGIFSIYNILNNEFQYDNSINDTFLQTSTTAVLPRMILMKLRYSF